MFIVWILLACLITLFFDVFYWCFLAVPCCVMLLLVNARTFVCSIDVHYVSLLLTNGEHSISVFCCCPSTFLWCVLLIFLAPLLCFVGARQCSFAMFYWCSSTFPCWALSMLVITPLLHSIGVRRHFLDALYWCSLKPFCYIMLVLIIAPLLCYVGVPQHIFVVFC
jgi:hypothetical protein